MKLVLREDVDNGQIAMQVELSLWQVIRGLFGGTKKWRAYIRGKSLRKANKNMGVFMLEGGKK